MAYRPSCVGVSAEANGTTASGNSCACDPGHGALILMLGCVAEMEDANRHGDRLDLKI